MSGELKPEDVLRLHFILDGQMSPNGKACAYVLSQTPAARDRDVAEIRVRDVDGGPDRCVSDGERLAHPRWSHEGSQLAYVEAAVGQSLLVLVDVPTGRRRKIALPGVIQGPPAWSPDDRSIALVLETVTASDGATLRITSAAFRADGMGFVGTRAQRIVQVEVGSTKVATIVDTLGFYSNLEWDDAGRQLLFMATQSPVPFAGYSPRLYCVRVENGVTRQLLGEDWFIALARWMPDGQSIALIGSYRSTLSVPVTDLYLVNIETGEHSCRSVDVEGQVGMRVHHDMPIWEACWQNGLVVNDSHSAWVTVQFGGRAAICEISLSGPTSCRPVLEGDRFCIALNASANRTKLLFMATDMLTPPELHVFDGRSETRLTRVNQDTLETWPVLRRRSFKVRSPDGLEMDAWFLADAAHSNPLPTVMFIHGGPFNAIGEAFRFDLHLLASHGFGVVFANFRGSFGYGARFARAIMGDWGARGFPDHMAVVDRAVELGFADPNRLGVWGPSHGGFATCWIVGHTTRFRAAIAEASSCNLATVYYLSDAPDTFARDLGGKPHEIPDVYRSRSPLSYAHRCVTPTLMIHGEQDLRCPIAEAEQFHRALLDAGCISEILRLKGASHLGDSIGPPATRVAQNEALLEWFERHL